MTEPSAFSMPTRLLFGEGAAQFAGRELAAMGARKVLVVSDRGLVGAGIVQPICGTLEAAGLGHAAFTDVVANPPVETVEACLAAYRESGCDALLAVGGGSPMDTAKAAGVLATNGGDIRHYEGPGKVLKPLPPLVAIPTTAGTGSEVTFFTVVTDRRRQFKMPIIGPLLAPRVAILDPLMVAGLPGPLVASTGMDALTHAVESYLSRAAHAFSQAQSLHAIRLIGQHLLAAVGGDHRSRGEMLYASCLAGLAFNTVRLGVCHAMTHPLGGVCGVPHGTANAIMLPHSMEFNRPAAADRLRDIAAALGVPVDAMSTAEGALAAVAEVRRLSAAAGIPARLRDVGVGAEAISQMAADAMTSGNILVNPRPVTLEDVVALYREAL